MAFVEEYKRFKERYNTELSLFRKYALGAKIHPHYNNKRIIMLRMDRIGDCTMFSSAARAIRDYYHDYEFTVVCLAISKPIFECIGGFDHIIALEHFKPEVIDEQSLNQVITELRKETYDILLQPQPSKYPVTDILAAAIRCNKRITIKGKYGNSTRAWIKLSELIYDKVIPIPEGNVSEFAYHGAFVRGVCDSSYETIAPSLHYDKQNFITEKYYVIFPGGSIRQKFWPARHFARIIDHIYMRTGMKGVVLGSPDESWIMEKIEQEMSEDKSNTYLNLIGKTSIKDVIDIIGNAEFIISNDTSGAHIACATQTPSVVILGGWHYERFFPYILEKVDKNDVLPKVAFTKMDCFHCDWVWSQMEKLNAECINGLKNDGICQCIEMIGYDQVEKIVDEIIDGDIG